MASAWYTRNIKPEDIQPDKPAEPMTKKQKWENFWFYYRWHVVAGTFVILLIVLFAYDILTQKKPDVEISLVTAQTLPDSLLRSITEQLQQNPAFEDVNGDGEVLVHLNQYNISTDGSQETDPTMQMAGTVKLTADIQAGLSTIFITDNIEGVQELTGIFSEEEGAVWVPWQQAEGMNQLDLVVDDPLLNGPTDFSDTMEDFVVARRGYTGNEKEDVLNTAKLGDKIYESLTGVPSRWK